jgi:hypothetical protein
VIHPVVKLEILWNSVVVRKGFFMAERREETNHMSSFHAAAVNLTEGFGGGA